jgi:hypothetical protein
MATGRTHDLEIDQDLAFQRRSWTVQRVGWVVIGVLLVLALAGLLGSGPLSRQQVELPGLLRLEYERFTRYQTPHTLTVRLQPGATSAAEARVWVDRRYLEGTKVEAITPSPLRVEAAADRLVYIFAMSRPGDPVTIAFTLQSEELGPRSGRVGLGGAGPVAPFRQFVYP